MSAAARALWRSRKPTACFLGGYALWLGLGLWNGLADLHDKDWVVAARLNFAARRDSWIELQGKATLYTLRKDRHRCKLVGPAVLSIAGTDRSGSALRLTIECEDVTPDARITVADEGSGATHVLDDLRARELEVTVPLPRRTTRVRLAPSSASFRYRILSLRVEDDVPGATFRVDVRWTRIHESDTHTIEQGAGFHDRPAERAGEPFGGDELLWTRRTGYLRITPHVEKDWRLMVVYRKAFDTYAEPVLSIDGRPLPIGPGSRQRDDGTRSVTVAAEGAGPVVVGFTLNDAVKSPRELGISQDTRRLGCGIYVTSCAVVSPN